MYANLAESDIGSDTVHPTDTGYRKMGNAWYAALRPVLGAGRPWPAYRDNFGVNDQQLTWTNGVAGSANVGGYCCGLTMMESGIREEIAQSDTRALMYSGSDNSASQSYSYNRVLDVHVPIDSDAVLTYWIYPQQANGTFAAIDLLLTDGRSLRDSGAVDQYGIRAHPLYQGQGRHLFLNQWNRVSIRLAPLAGGIIDQIHLGYDQPASTGIFRGYVDTVDITSA